ALGRTPNMPADHLFRSLAAIQKSRAVGIILSGGGTDGTLGFQSIKAEGGITFAQDERSAKQAGMPRSAISDRNVDYVMPPRDIAQQLAKLIQHTYTRQESARDPLPDTEEAVKDVLALMRTRTGVDFTHYKRSTIKRRIQRRMALQGLEGIGDYVQLLRT